MRLKIDQTPLQIISSQRGCIHAGEYVVFQDFPHLRPSFENELEVTEAVKFLEIHGSVQVLVGRFHKRLKDHPGERCLETKMIDWWTLERCWRWGRNADWGKRSLEEVPQDASSFQQSPSNPTDGCRVLLQRTGKCEEVFRAFLPGSHGLRQSCKIRIGAFLINRQETDYPKGSF